MPRIRPAIPSRILTTPQLAALIAAARDRKHPNAIRDHAMLAILGNTGLQIGEVVTLRPGDLELGGRSPRIHVVRRRGKRVRGQAAEIPITPPLAHLLTLYRARIPLGQILLFPVTVRRLRALFHYYAGLAGLPATLPPYTLRHTAAMRYMDASGGDPSFVAYMLGHRRLRDAVQYLSTHEKLARTHLERLDTIL